MVKDIKDLEKLLKLCRKQGVTDLEFEGLKIKLGDLPLVKPQPEEEEYNEEEIDLLTGLPKAAFYSSDVGA